MPASAGAAPLLAKQGPDLLVTSTSHGRPTVMRLRLNGTIDSSFGVRGVARIGYGRDAKVTGMITQPDGTIDLAVEILHCMGHSCSTPVAVVQITASGALDASFGDGGHAQVYVTGTGGSGGLVRAPDGSLFVVAVTFYAPPPDTCLNFDCDLQQLVAKLQPDGTLDPSFGSGGIASVIDKSIKRDAFTHFVSVALQPDGSVLAGGPPDHMLDGPSAVARFLPDGSLDPSFGGGDGLVATRTPVTGIIPTDRGFVVGGAVGQDCCRLAGTNFGVERRLPSGSRDRAFAHGSPPRFTLGAQNDAAGTLVSDPSGRLLLAGEVFRRCRSNGSGPRNCLPPSVVVFRSRRGGGIDREFGVNGRATARVRPRARNSDWSRTGGVSAVATGGRTFVAATASYRHAHASTDLPATVVVAFNRSGALATRYGSRGRVKLPTDPCPGAHCLPTR